MQLISFLTVTIAAIVAVLLTATPALAVDNRKLYSFSGGNGTVFCKSWKCACINYEPKNTKLNFQTAYCKPGDYSGKNKTTEALAFCSFTNGTKTTLVSKHIANATDATLV